MEGKMQFTVSGEEKEMKALVAGLRAGGIPVTNEIQLNRLWDCDEDGEPIGQHAFVVTEDYAKKVYNELFADRYESFEEFLDVYEPETEGQAIYDRAIADGVLINEFYDEEV